ncbi:MAG: hypothetical protein Q4G02_01245 [bacterium]|nr:hypothetical protein [bacterium]
MKKFLPFILPALAVILVVVFAYRFYQQRTAERLPTPEVTAGAEIEELSVAELEALEKMGRGVGNYETAKMTGDQGNGEIRFEKKNDKVYFTVTANLPESKEDYKLWLKQADAEKFVASKALTLGKAGLIAATAADANTLPLTVEVRLQEQVVLRGEVK